MKKIFFLLTTVSLQIFALAGCENPNPNVYKVGELVEKAAADKDNWTGKEVTVSGYVMIKLNSDGANNYRLDLIDHRNDQSERHVVCKVSQGAVPEGIETKTVEVKGKISSVTTQNYLNMKTVVLDSCEIKK